ncbi:MAG: hypothetical protein EPO07_08095 [Verrucomicrobia bacterium]|nr:MAG: hypothetical protein EPO07_08095 [Verrucomicrobiota bacterium]
MKNSLLRKGFASALVGAGLLLLTSAARAEYPTNVVSQILTGTNTWYHTNTYWLNGAVFVMSNAVLNIEAGTIIKGHNLGGQGTNVGALYICRGGKIYAEGTPHHPIIFTADVDDTTLPDDLDIYARGLWGGLVLFGNCVLNGTVDAGGNAASPKYEVYEGLTDITLGGQQVFRFGGNNDDDNSGVLRYVSIRHGGTVLAPNKEINGLSLGAVGRGTTIEYVESYAAADDGFEFFGGTVNTKYLVSSFNDDDSFDVDMGYRGTNQFWFAIQAPDKRNYGMELNNHPNELSQTNQLLPAADFKVYNLTIIGSGSVNNTNVNGGANHAIALRPWVGPKIYNAIFTDFNAQGVLLDTQNGITATQAVTGAYAQLHNTLWWGFTRGSGSTTIDNTITNLGRNTVATNFWTDTSLTNEISDPLLASISRTNSGVYLDPRPAAGSPAYSDYAATPSDGFLTPVNYRGAFGSNDLWIDHWTALAEYGILQRAAIQTNVVSQILTGTNNWYRTNTYWLNGAVFVMSNAVLNIEAGTIIKGHNLGGQGTNVGALYICRGGKIYAEGTPQNPIIFTADVDDTTLPDDVDIYARGLWGGLVLFGNSVLNGAVDAGGNAASPKYEVYEGLTDITLGGQQVFRFGGNDDDDNSGVLRYVSIRHGGTVLAPNKEINGLSLGAVGRGTTIEYVEAYAAADDGFEFFGGTVNTKYLVSSFNDDDSFDVDMGYRGTNQFWFAIQAPDKRNYGMELNNHPNELSQTNQLLPAADFKVYNLTIIGSGSVNNTNVNGGANHAIALRPWVGPKIYNAIFTDFNAQGVLLDTQNGVTATQAVTGAYAQLHNTLWWGFTRGSGSTIIDNTITNLGRNTLATNFWTDTSLTNEISDPLLASISRTNSGVYLDPRPAAGSPAANNFASVPSGLTTASCRGAFASGRGNWAADWTALSEYGVMGGAGGINPLSVGATAATPPPNAVTLSLTPSGANVIISFTSQAGYTYTLESTTVLPSGWATATGVTPSNPQTGTGGTLTFTVAAGTESYYRIKAN